MSASVSSTNPFQIALLPDLKLGKISVRCLPNTLFGWALFWKQSTDGNWRATTLFSSNEELPKHFYEQGIRVSHKAKRQLLKTASAYECILEMPHHVVLERALVLATLQTLCPATGSWNYPWRVGTHQGKLCFNRSIATLDPNDKEEDADTPEAIATVRESELASLKRLGINVVLQKSTLKDAEGAIPDQLIVLQEQVSNASSFLWNATALLWLEKFTAKKWECTSINHVPTFSMKDPQYKKLYKIIQARGFDLCFTVDHPAQAIHITQVTLEKFQYFSEIIFNPIGRPSFSHLSPQLLQVLREPPPSRDRTVVTPQSQSSHVTQSAGYAEPLTSSQTTTTSSSSSTPQHFSIDRFEYEIGPDLANQLKQIKPGVWQMITTDPDEACIVISAIEILEVPHQIEHASESTVIKFGAV